MKEKLSSITSFLNTKGFSVTEDKVFNSFDDYLVLYSSGLHLIKISSSKSFDTMEICYTRDKQRFFDMALIKALIFKERSLDKPMLFFDLIEFLTKNFDAILELFSASNYSQTKMRLENLEKERVKQMFPNLISG